MSISKQIDEICDHFEAAWKAGEQPSLREAFKSIPKEGRTALAKELIPLDIECRTRHATIPAATDYAMFGAGGVKIAEEAIAAEQRAEDSGTKQDTGYEETIIGSDPPPGSSDAGSDENEKSPQIGPYKILQQIGEGGMGSVFMAQQTEPVKRRVALKVIKSDTPSREILTRFEAERQAVAMMDHPNIAKVLDTGITEDGRPYFAMELVQGISITEYCDENKLSPNERLDLFMQTCRAVQHAHMKGIVHRDLKPGNVLVTQTDGKPVAKVIDFGLAKALQDANQLTDKTLFTQYGQVVGTLAYMSPEQAEMNTLDVDTRTDVYSLGVILYELLTGSTPITRERLRGEAFDRILALIREEEATRPSARLSESGDAITGISEQRKTQPKRLSLILKGDLDWIAVKALEKDRTRRYDTPASLADDVQRYLDDEAIEARPPSVGYRLNRFLKRHRMFATAVAVCVLLLLAGITTSTFFAVKSSRAEVAALTERDHAEQLADTFRAVLSKPRPGKGKDVRVLDVLDEAAVLARTQGGSPATRIDLLSTIALTYQNLGASELSLPLWQSVVADSAEGFGDDHQRTLIARHNLAVAYTDCVDKDETPELFASYHRRANELFADIEPHLGRLPPDAELVVLRNRILSDSANSRREALNELLTEFSDRLAPTHPEYVATKFSLASEECEAQLEFVESDGAALDLAAIKSVTKSAQLLLQKFKTLNRKNAGEYSKLLAGSALNNDWRLELEMASAVVSVLPMMAEVSEATDSMDVEALISVREKMAGKLVTAIRPYMDAYDLGGSMQSRQMKDMLMLSLQMQTALEQPDSEFVTQVISRLSQSKLSWGDAGNFAEALQMIATSEQALYALEPYRSRLNLRPESEPAEFKFANLVGQLLESAQRYPEARQIYSRQLATRSALDIRGEETFRLHLNIGRMWRFEDEEDRAVAALKKAMECPLMSSGTVESSSVTKNAYLQMKAIKTGYPISSDLEIAVLAGESWEADTESILVWMGINADELLEVLGSIIERAPEDADVSFFHCETAELHIANRDYGQAVSSLKKCGSNSDEVLFSYFQIDDQKDARSRFVRISIDDAIAECLFLSGNLKEAAQAYDKLLSTEGGTESAVGHGVVLPGDIATMMSDRARKDAVHLKAWRSLNFAICAADDPTSNEQVLRLRAAVKNAEQLPSIDELGWVPGSRILGMKARAELARALVRQGKQKEAAAEFRQVLKVEPTELYVAGTDGLLWNRGESFDFIRLKIDAALAEMVANDPEIDFELQVAIAMSLEIRPLPKHVADRIYAVISASRMKQHEAASQLLSDSEPLLRSVSFSIETFNALSLAVKPAVHVEQMVTAASRIDDCQSESEAIALKYILKRLKSNGDLEDADVVKWLTRLLIE